MANVLLTWEQGGALGHITVLEPIGNALSELGHTVYAALRDLSRAKLVFRRSQIKLLQAPLRHELAPDQFQPPCTFAHILHNTCFGDGTALQGRAEAWQRIIELVKPDLLVCDYSPTALLVSRLFDLKRVYLGSGFLCPPDAHPLPNFRRWNYVPNETLVQDERRVLAVVNAWLAKHGRKPLGRLVDIFTDADDCLLVTFPELDHYGKRPGAEYQGVWSSRMGEPPQWPQGNGKRVFVYLKQFPHLELILTHLRQWRLPTLAYISNLDPSLREQMTCSTIHFADAPVDLSLAAKQCDFAVLHANHGTMATVLLAGKPLLMLPSQLEQRLLADKVEKLGAGVKTNMDDAENIRTQLQDLLFSDRYENGAQAFAAKYADFDSDEQLRKVVSRLEAMVS